jgi:voltage-gated potassium channel
VAADRAHSLAAHVPDDAPRQGSLIGGVGQQRRDGHRLARARLPNPVRGSLDRFASNPASIRYAARVLVVATILVVLVASVVVWVFDSGDYPDFATALWFTLQTATTVGYGDVTPTSPIGRLIAGIVMVFSIAFITIVTALVTSALVDAAQRRRSRDEESRGFATSQRLLERIDELDARLERIEAALSGAQAQPRRRG